MVGNISDRILRYEVNSLCLALDSASLIEVTAERRRQRDGSSLWAVKRLSECLNSGSEWEYEPIPSSRDDAFIARCRFPSLGAAINAFRLSELGRKAVAVDPVAGDSTL